MGSGNNYLYLCSRDWDPFRFGMDATFALLGKRKEECCIEGSERGVKGVDCPRLAWHMTPGPMFHTHNCQLAQTTRSLSFNTRYISSLAAFWSLTKMTGLYARDACPDGQGFVISSARIKMQNKLIAVDPISSQTEDY